MSGSKTELKIFLSSPGDVTVERQIARRILDQLKDDPLIRDDIQLEVVAWDDPHSRTLMPVSMTPQEAIDRGLPRPADCDIVVVVFWGRMGTPLDVKRHGTKDNGEPYWSGTEWEYLDAMRGLVDNKTGLPLIYIYHRTDTPTAPDLNDLEAMKDSITQRERVNAFFAQFRDPVTKAYRSNIHEYDTSDKFAELFEVDAKLLIREAQKLRTGKTAKPEPITPAVPTWEGSPFPGLHPLMPEDAPIYFGRGRETAELVKRLAATPFVAVVGASGSGKSSLVGAGLIPKLKDDAIPGSRDWHIVRFTPGEQPYLRLAEALIDTLPSMQGDPVDYVRRCETLAETLRQAPDALAKTANHALKDDKDWAKILLFVDQFEELLTLTPPDQRAIFAAMLTHASERVRVVLTMRADFYHRAIEVAALADKLRDGSFPFAAPDRFALLEMIERPAERAGLVFEADLAKHIVNETGDEPGALALMAYLLDKMYQITVERGDRHLTFADYYELGGVEGAIGKRANEVFLAVEADEKEKLIHLLRIFRNLLVVTVEGTPTRKRCQLSQIAEDEMTLHLIKVLTDARLLIQDEDDGEAIIEVAHEALFKSWSLLSNWISMAKDDLYHLEQMRQAAMLWSARGEDKDYLWSDERLKPIYRILQRLELDVQRDLSVSERRFLVPEDQRLLREIEDINTTHQRRSTIGERLSVIGDPRKGVGLRSDGLPDIGWCYVEGGELKIEIKEATVSTPYASQYYEDERKTIHTFKLEPFYISRYLITYSQFQAFIDAEDGFHNDLWWVDMPREHQKETIPMQYSKYASYPRDSISWFHAVAFTRWLTARLPSDVLPGVLSDNCKIRLPTEWEWQWAAQGGSETRDYPWGTWNGSYANTSESGIGHTTMVGFYPHGSAVCGAMDMSGNLWKWMLNEIGDIRSIEVNNNNRVLRGGAFITNADDANCVSRSYFNYIRGFVYTYGFRVVYAPDINLMEVGSP